MGLDLGIFERRPPLRAAWLRRLGIPLAVLGILAMAFGACGPFWLDVSLSSWDAVSEFWLAFTGGLVLLVAGVLMLGMDRLLNPPAAP